MSTRNKLGLGVLVILMLIAGVLLVGKGSMSTTKKDVYRIGIFQIARHPVFDAMADGFREKLESRLPGKVQFEDRAADSDKEKIEQIANFFVSNRYDLVFVIGTNCGQSLARKTKEIPIVLGGATDPKAADLVDSWEHPGRNVTGTSDLSPVGEQLDRVKELLPSVSKIGVIYNPEEENSKFIVSRFKEECIKRKLSPIAVTLSKPNESRQTIVALAGRVDALYVPTDASIQAAFDTIIKVANELRIPVFNCDEGTVNKGAVFSVGFNYRDIGKTSAEMAADILEGKSKPAEMPIRLVGNSTLYYNLAQIGKFGLTLPKPWEEKGQKVAE